MESTKTLVLLFLAMASFCGSQQIQKPFFGFPIDDRFYPNAVTDNVYDQIGDSNSGYLLYLMMRCPEGSIFMNGTCLSVVGSSCSSGYCVQNAQCCHSTKECACTGSGFQHDPVYNLCLPKTKGFNVKCSQGNPCAGDFVCSKGTCVCPDSLVYNETIPDIKFNKRNAELVSATLGKCVCPGAMYLSDYSEKCARYSQAVKSSRTSLFECPGNTVLDRRMGTCVMPCPVSGDCQCIGDTTLKHRSCLPFTGSVYFPEHGSFYCPEKTVPEEQRCFFTTHRNGECPPLSYYRSPWGCVAKDGAVFDPTTRGYVCKPGFSTKDGSCIKI